MDFLSHFIKLKTWMQINRTFDLVIENRRMFKIPRANGTHPNRLLPSKLTHDVMVNMCADIHQRLHGIVNSINSCYSMQVTFIYSMQRRPSNCHNFSSSNKIMNYLVGVFGHVLRTLYDVCGIFILNKTEDIPLAASELIWAIYFGIFTVLTAHVGTRLAEEVSARLFIDWNWRVWCFKGNQIATVTIFSVRKHFSGACEVAGKISGRKD